jgi:hypothetical protein
VRVALFSILYAGCALAQAGEKLEFEADELIMDEALWRGSGSVVLRLGAVSLTGEAATFDSDGGRLEVLNGSFEAPEAPALEFERAVWDGAVFEFFGPVWVDAETGLLAKGASIQLGANRVLSGEDIELGCNCDGPSPWVLRTRTLRWDDEGLLTLKGARVGLFGASFLPLPPLRIPLTRRSGLLIPELGYGIDGFRLKTPLFLTVGDAADITLTPELRTDRSLRLLAEQRLAMVHGSGDFQGAAGYDWRREKPRGGARWKFGWSRQRWNVATIGQLRGDADYLRDYGDRFLARQTPWTESRMLLGWRQVELWSDLFQSEQKSSQELGALAARLPATAGPLGSLIDGELLGAFRGLGANPWEVGEASWAGSAQLGLERPKVLGPLLVRPSILGRAQRLSTAMSGQALAGLELRLLGWSATNGYTRVEPGIHIESEIGAFGRREVIRPELGLRRVDQKGGIWDLSLSSRFAEGRARVEGWLGLERGGVSWWAQGSSDGLGVSEAASGLGLGTADLDGDLLWVWVADPSREQPFYQGRFELDWRLPGPLSVLKLGGGLGLDLLEGEALSRHLGFAYLHPSGCLAIGLDGWLDSDREWPDLIAKLQFVPGRG